MIQIKKGLDLPIEGSVKQVIGKSPEIKSVAVLGVDYVGLRPAMAVKIGDSVSVGQELFRDKKNSSAVFTAPVHGVVKEINRGEKRALHSVVIESSSKTENSGKSFEKFSEPEINSLEKDKICTTLINAGLWVALRTRPYSKVPEASEKPAAIFINAMDSNPLSPYPGYIIETYEKYFRVGCNILSKLSAGKTYVCHDEYTKVDSLKSNQKIQTQIFSGVHPAGLVGTHIHFLEPVSDKKTVWHISYQDVIAIGKLFLEGELWCERIISIGGPVVKNAELLQVPLGTSINDILKDRVTCKDFRAISGSVFSGREARNDLAYLSRYDLQVSVLEEGRKREFLAWQAPGLNKFSVKNTFISSLLPGGRLFPFTTSKEGGSRAMVPIGSYEKIMPLDIEPTFLLRSLLNQDSEEAVNLGALELDEEDLSLCTFVCPGKSEYGPLLRSILSTVEKEG